MPTQLYANSAVYFICARNFTWEGIEYELGDEFDQDIAPGRIDLLVRTRRLFAVVDDGADKPRHWHHHVWLREDLSKKLAVLKNSRATTLQGESLYNKYKQTGLEFDSVQTDKAAPTPSEILHAQAHEAALTEKVLDEENQEDLSDGCRGEHDPAGNPDCEMGPADPRDEPAEGNPVGEDAEDEDQYTEEDLFDPSEHTVPEVNEYLESDITDTERQRVLAAEEAGKRRVGIIGD